MFRSLIGSCSRVCGSLFKSAHLLRSQKMPCLPLSASVPSVFQSNGFSTIRPVKILPNVVASRILLNPATPEVNSSRALTKYSLQKGKRKTVHSVLMRFYRLDWGIWIRTKCGRHKKIYKKSWRRRRRLRQHVFTNATQSWLLDTMVTRYWRKPKYIPDDPYNPYHKREEYFVTRKTPQVPVAS